MWGEGLADHPGQPLPETTAFSRQEVEVRAQDDEERKT